MHSHVSILLQSPFDRFSGCLSHICPSFAQGTTCDDCHRKARFPQRELETAGVPWNEVGSLMQELPLKELFLWV
jgi:hypothetical protein